jgi:hypothetical protein
MKLRFAHAFTLLALGSVALAQEPAARGAASATLNGKKVTIDYGRPSLKGRSMDDLLKQLPADRIWRAGENQVTTLYTETDLMIGGKTVKAGKYSVYVHAPATGDWSLVLNSDLGIPLVKLWDKAPDNMKNEPWPHLEGYSNVATKEVARTPMTGGKSAASTEQFTISLAPKADAAALTLAWGDKTWSTDLKAAK